MYAKTRSHQREDTGLTRLQSHISSFEAFSCTIDEFQWFNNDGRSSPVAGGAQPEAAPAAGRDRASRTKGRGIPPRSGGSRPGRPGRGRGSGNGQDSDRRAQGAARRLGTAGREPQRGGSPGATAAPFAQHQPALAGRGPTHSTLSTHSSGTRRPHPAGPTAVGRV